MNVDEAFLGQSVGQVRYTLWCGVNIHSINSINLKMPYGMYINVNILIGILATTYGREGTTRENDCTYWKKQRENNIASSKHIQLFACFIGFVCIFSISPCPLTCVNCSAIKKPMLINALTCQVECSFQFDNLWYC